jgi:hypothetical protein
MPDIIDRDEQRKKKLAKKRPSPFAEADRQAKSQKERDARGPSKPKKKKKSYHSRDYRGTRGAIKDIEEGKK